MMLVLSTAMGYIEQIHPPHVVAPCLSVAHGIFAEDPPTRDNPANVDLYCRYVLPLLSGLHYSTYQSQMATILEMFVKGVPSLTATPTMKALIAHFPMTRSSKAIEFLRLLTTTVARVPTHDVRANMRDVFLLFANCTALGHVKIAAAATPIWNRIELEPLMIDNARFVFGLALPVLQQAQKDAWSQDIVYSIEEIFKVLTRIDSLVFQEVCRAKPKAGAQNPNQDSLKNWAAVARSASKMDKTVNLGEKLAEIQKVFSASAGTYKAVSHDGSGRQIKSESLPVTTQTPLGVRHDLRPLIRVPVF
jgi:hypothetical protein